MTDYTSDRLDQMATEIHKIGHSQKMMQWFGAILVGIIIAVVGVNLTRVFALGDSVSGVGTKVAVVENSLRFIQSGVSEIKSDVKDLRHETAAIRTGVERISGAMELQSVPPLKEPQEPQK